MNTMGLWIWSSSPTNTQETVHSQASNSKLLLFHWLENFAGPLSTPFLQKEESSTSHTHPPQLPRLLSENYINYFSTMCLFSIHSRITHVALC